MFFSASSRRAECETFVRSVTREGGLRQRHIHHTFDCRFPEEEEEEEVQHQQADSLKLIFLRRGREEEKKGSELSQ